ncbi:MAG: glycine dehydrogenase subunit 2 [Thermotogaceae bacterium]|nr:glycine dehydrogenase subunit 2 [Thermotogaceae bacterium]MDN5336990.1 glycine dehydrogenase subunit 2 [Thermotogaceae bacterium]
MKLIFEKSKDGRTGYSLPKLDVPEKPIEEMIPESLIRKEEAELPQVYETEVVRHYTNLSRLNHAVDVGFYPLGSCTMKYNPKVNEKISKFDGFAYIHPYQPEETVQGALEIMYNLQILLCEITGMDYMTLQPAAGAHGELTGMSIIKKYHEDRGDFNRNKVLVPDSAHGTNPASAAMCGFEVIELKSTEQGLIDLEELKKNLDENTAAVMLTNPNTLGLYEKDIDTITRLAHEAGALLYYDGANLNAIMGKVRPGDMGFDVVHLNLHKTFSTPHGMGGPGSGPVGVKAFLKDYLPIPVVEQDEKGFYYFNYDLPKSIGKVRSFYGNFGVFVKAYAYILFMGKSGLKKASELAVLNANYLRSKISKFLKIASDIVCMHEFVVDGSEFKKYGVKTLDVAKRLLDYGYHPPTVYFPLIVPEALMIEPTETETKETLDGFAETLEKILKEAEKSSELLKNAPHNTYVRRLDEARAVKNPILRWKVDV